MPIDFNPEGIAIGNAEANEIVDKKRKKFVEALMAQDKRDLCAAYMVAHDCDQKNAVKHYLRYWKHPETQREFRRWIDTHKPEWESREAFMLDYQRLVNKADSSDESNLQKAKFEKDVMDRLGEMLGYINSKKTEVNINQKIGDTRLEMSPEVEKELIDRFIKTRNIAGNTGAGTK